MLPIILTGVAAVVGGALSARWNWWRFPQDGIPVLMYHKVGDPPVGSRMGSLWVSARMFRKQMGYLSENGYHPVTCQDILNHWDGVRSLPTRPVLVTFDDGYANNHEVAFPIMRDFGFRGTVFVVAKTVGWDNHWHDPANEVRIPMASWVQLKELQKAGWEIGSHTLNHRHLPELDPGERAFEIEQSRRTIGDFLDVLPNAFAYPYGAGEDDPDIREQVRLAGYRIAVGIHVGKWTLAKIQAAPYALPRIFVRGDDTMVDFHLQMTRGRSRL